MANYIEFLNEKSLKRFMDKIKFTDSCWFWQAEVDKDGYGKFKLTTGVRVMAHRLSYEWFVESIPKTFVIDHQCLITNCVNPIHLSAMTAKKNTYTHFYSSETECSEGHLRSFYELKTSEGKAYCLICRREKEMVRYKLRELI